MIACNPSWEDVLGAHMYRAQGFCLVGVWHDSNCAEAWTCQYFTLKKSPCFVLFCILDIYHPGSSRTTEGRHMLSLLDSWMCWILPLPHVPLSSERRTGEEPTRGWFSSALPSDLCFNYGAVHFRWSKFSLPLNVQMSALFNPEHWAERRGAGLSKKSHVGG